MVREENKEDEAILIILQNYINENNVGHCYGQFRYLYYVDSRGKHQFYKKFSRVLIEFLDQYPAVHEKIKDDPFTSPLVLAVVEKDAQLARGLIKLGYNPNLKIHDDKALIYFFEEDVSFKEYLVSKGAAIAVERVPYLKNKKKLTIDLDWVFPNKKNESREQRLAMLLDYLNDKNNLYVKYKICL